MVVLNRAVKWLCFAGFVLASACRPDVSERASLVTSPRVLAIAADPPEAEERAAVTYSALVVDTTGQVPALTTDWAICTARKPLALIEPVNPICLSRTGDFLLPLGQGTSATGVVPSDACRLFGPEVPQPKPGEPFGRPTDPDLTGGYYLPVRVILARNDGDKPYLGASRIACGVAGASSTDTGDFNTHYHTNANPTITALTANGGPVGTDDASATSISAGVVHFEVDWPACPDPDVCGDGVCGPDETRADCMADCAKPTSANVGCPGAERYYAYDSEAQRNVVRREVMRAAWFTTAGVFSVDTSGRDETDTTTNAQNDLTLTGVTGKVYGWVVLTDARGGATWRAWVLDVH